MPRMGCFDFQLTLARNECPPKPSAMIDPVVVPVLCYTLVDIVLIDSSEASLSYTICFLRTLCSLTLAKRYRQMVLTILCFHTVNPHPVSAV